MKKGRHRRYEEARALKRSSEEDIESLMERLDEDPFNLPVTAEANKVGLDDDGDDDDIPYTPKGGES